MVDTSICHVADVKESVSLRALQEYLRPHSLSLEGLSG